MQLPACTLAPTLAELVGTGTQLRALTFAPTQAELSGAGMQLPAPPVFPAACSTQPQAPPAQLPAPLCAHLQQPAETTMLFGTCQQLPSQSRNLQATTIQSSATVCAVCALLCFLLAALTACSRCSAALSSSYWVQRTQALFAQQVSVAAACCNGLKRFWPVALYKLIGAMDDSASARCNEIRSVAQLLLATACCNGTMLLSLCRSLQLNAAMHACKEKGCCISVQLHRQIVFPFHLPPYPC
eukprot:1157226-Pelagomonas_calceolata.AAC.10